MDLMTPELLAWLTELIKEDDLIKFYKSKEWRILRSVCKKRDNYECQSCKRQGKYSKADMVHHLVEVKRNPRLALTLSNLECECNACHNRLHPEKLSGFQKKKYTNEERW